MPATGSYPAFRSPPCLVMLRPPAEQRTRATRCFPFVPTCDGRPQKTLFAPSSCSGPHTTPGCPGPPRLHGQLLRPSVRCDDPPLHPRRTEEHRHAAAIARLPSRGGGAFRVGGAPRRAGWPLMCGPVRIDVRQGGRRSVRRRHQCKRTVCVSAELRGRCRGAVRARAARLLLTVLVGGPVDRTGPRFLIPT